jgi:RecJ-like exonuclease
MTICPSCRGKGIVWVPNDDEAECLACAGTGEFPVICQRCSRELRLNVLGDWTHTDPIQNSHRPRLKPPPPLE